MRTESYTDKKNSRMKKTVVLVKHEKHIFTIANRNDCKKKRSQFSKKEISKKIEKTSKKSLFFTKVKKKISFFHKNGIFF